jgi:hypothetical protein
MLSEADASSFPPASQASAADLDLPDRTPNSRDWRTFPQPINDAAVRAAFPESIPPWASAIAYDTQRRLAARVDAVLKANPRAYDNCIKPGVPLP